MKMPPASPFAGDDEVRNDGRNEEDRSDESFGEESQRKRRVSDVEALRLSVFEAGEEAIEREEQKEGKDGFGDERAREEKDADRGEHGQGWLNAGEMARYFAGATE